MRRLCNRAPSRSDPVSCFPSCGGHSAQPSFPTRRSSDLYHQGADRGASVRLRDYAFDPADGRDLEDDRSEEHTSELQSPCNLVCRLLLEKNNSPLSAVYVLTRPQLRITFFAV